MKPKIIQIACDGGERIYGLDADGIVWEWVQGGWRPVRNAPDPQPSPEPSCPKCKSNRINIGMRMAYCGDCNHEVSKEDFRAPDPPLSPDTAPAFKHRDIIRDKDGRCYRIRSLHAVATDAKDRAKEINLMFCTIPTPAERAAFEAEEAKRKEKSK